MATCFRMGKRAALKGQGANSCPFLATSNKAAWHEGYESVAPEPKPGASPSARFVLKPRRYSGDKTRYFNTQKAAGLAWLEQQVPHDGAQYPAGIAMAGDVRFITDERELGRAMGDIDAERFARPCPITPRHGFVESRSVRTARELLDVWMEARGADPEAEVILMPRLSGKWSGILTNAGALIGRGHDGATGGAASLLIPAPVSAGAWRAEWKRFGDGERPAPGIAQTPYCEFVENDGGAALVQLRDGPESPVGHNWVPAPVTVEMVLEPIDHKDMLRWETQVNRAKSSGAAGIVVYLPGMGLASHAAVHAICAGFPVITTGARPAVGATIQPEGKRRVFAETDAARVATLLRAAFADNAKIEREVQPRVLFGALGVIHACPLWDAEPHLLRLMAWSLRHVTQFAYAAIAGELRHYGKGRGHNRRANRYASSRPFDCGVRNCRACAAAKAEWEQAEADKRNPNQIPLPAPLAPSPKPLDVSRLTRGYSDRGHVYKAALRVPFAKLGRHLALARRAYELSGAWASGYGGDAWLNVTNAALGLVGAIETFLAAPTLARLDACVAAANLLINTAHNGGKVFDKWINTDSMSRCARTPQFAFLAPPVIETALGEDWA